ncbi:flavin reductase family protein [uncultured Finegoldia sp.]|mgnify:FL=1|uniref:flavin reductase family protein n=1 Tax=uncultured Finegoldia sp. TaxID=328009 RepID=UPI0025D72C29|nr:flavin reductase [uncultured Finegoldia sp.]
MNKRKIDVMDYASDIVKELPKGIFLNTKANGKFNSMAIAWGTIGYNWNKPVFVCYVREGRFTRELLDENPEFTISVPIGSYDKKIMKVCGSQSGRDVDKVEEANLTLVEPETISVNGIKELPLTIECKLIYRQEQDLSLLPDIF